MKVAVYYSRRDIRIENSPTPSISDDEVLVEMHACGVCGSDLMDWYVKRRAPLVLGHEPTGIIVKKGKQVSGFDLDDRVFVHHHVADLDCYYCKHGDYTLCSQFHSTRIIPGGFAEYFKVPAANLLDTLKIPDGMSYEEGTFIEPLGCCMRALGKTGVQKGDSVAIIGAGVAGIMLTALAKLNGVGKVIVSDLVDHRLSVAKAMGADIAVNPSKADVAGVVGAQTCERGADLVIVAASSASAYETALKICRKGGKVLIFAPTEPGNDMRVSPHYLFFRENQIISSYSTSHIETRKALNLIEEGKLNVKSLITHRFRLADTARAFEEALSGKNSLKVLVVNE